MLSRIDAQMKRFKYDMVPRLQFLRTSKTARAEATAIFHAENDFCFTNVDGWYILASFLAIGRKNSKLIHSIAVRLPWCG